MRESIVHFRIVALVRMICAAKVQGCIDSKIVIKVGVVLKVHCIPPLFSLLEANRSDTLDKIGLAVLQGRL